MPAARTVASLGVAQTFAWGTTYYLPAVLANSISADLGVSTTQVFVAFSLGLLIAGFVGPASGRLIDLHGGHRVLPASNIVLALGLGLLASSNGMAMLVASWLLIGCGMSAGLYEAAFSTLARIYGADARRAITGITLIAGFASTVCWPLSAWMDATIGWRAACWLWAFVHLAVCLPLNASLPRAALHEREIAHEQARQPRRNELLVMAALSFVFGATWFCSTAMAAHLPRLLQESGSTLVAAIAAAALVGPAQVAARVFEFALVRRMHPIISARVASLAHPVGAGALIAFGAPAGTFFALTHGAGNGIMTIANGTLPLRLFGAAGYGLRQGILMAPARLMQAAAPFAFDLALSRFGTSALYLTGGLSLLSFATLMAIRSARSED
jgi:MFS family permease